MSQASIRGLTLLWLSGAKPPPGVGKEVRPRPLLS